MARYFDPAVPADAAYLPTKWRTAADVARVAEAAEADLVAAYTRDLRSESPLLSGRSDTPGLEPVREYLLLGEGLAVYLRHYQTDSAQVVDPTASAARQVEQAAFLVAMKRTVALVVEWRLLRDQKDVQLQGQSDGTGRHHQLHPRAQEEMPANWGRWLRPYDTRPPLVHI